MRYSLISVVLALFVIFLNGCANNTPPRRVTSAAALPRRVALESKKDQKSATHLGYNRSAAWADGGNLFEASVWYVGGDINLTDWLSFGFDPFMGRINGELDDNTNWGAETYLRLRLVNGEKNRFYLYPSYRFTTNRAKGEYCSFTLFTTCAQPSAHSTTVVKIYEPGGSMIFQRDVSAKGRIAFSPSAYYTQVQTVNQADGLPDFSRKEKIWNYAALFYYTHAFSDSNESNFFQLGLGALFNKSFDPASGSKRKVMFMGDASLMLGF